MLEHEMYVSVKKEAVCMLEMVVKVVSAFLLLLVLVGTCVLLLEAWWYSKKRLDEMPGSSLTLFEKMFYAVGDIFAVASEWKDYFIIRMKEIFMGYHLDMETPGSRYARRYSKKEISERAQTMGKTSKARIRLKV